MQGKSIMVVDDDEACLRLIRQQLTIHGDYVITAEDTRIARGYLMGVCVDLLIVDLAMVGESGEAFAAWAKRICPNTKIVIYSGHPRRIQDMEEKGCVCLKKPASMADLFALVESA